MSILNGSTADVAGSPVPALDPRALYSSRLSARSALFTDLQLLLIDPVMAGKERDRARAK